MSKNLMPLIIIVAIIFAGIASIFLLSNAKSTGSSDLNLNSLLTQTPAAPNLNPTNGIISPTPENASSAGNMDNFQTTSDGLKIQDEVLGTGKEVKSGDTVTVNYLGTLTNGQKFDSSYDRNQPFTTQIGVGQVIKGWDEGIVGMKVGGKRKLVIPPALGYGDQAAGTIPPNSTLVFEVELMDVK